MRRWSWRALVAAACLVSACADPPSKEIDQAQGAIDAGAKGYLLKTVTQAELIDAIRLVANGSATVYTPVLNKAVNGRFEVRRVDNGARSLNGLSQRETEVLLLVAQGESNKEIATRLFISETTVKAHMRSILDKWKVKNRAQAAAMASEKGFLSQPYPPEEAVKKLVPVGRLINGAREFAEAKVMKA